MIVLTLNAKRKRILLGVLAVIAVVAVLFAIRTATGVASQSDTGEIDLSAGTNAERIVFLSQFGWQVEEEAIEVKEVTIPQTFNEVYTRYNKLQQEQGMDLSDYAGSVCKMWVYLVTNYPEQAGEVHATLIVLDGMVIGGDISSTALDGFMHGFGENAGVPSKAGEEGKDEVSSEEIKAETPQEVEGETAAETADAPLQQEEELGTQKETIQGDVAQSGVPAMEEEETAGEETQVDADAWPTD